MLYREYEYVPAQEDAPVIHVDKNCKLNTEHLCQNHVLLFGHNALQRVTKALGNFRGEGAGSLHRSRSNMTKTCLQDFVATSPNAVNLRFK